MCPVERMAVSQHHRICLWLAFSLAQVLFVTCQDAKAGKLRTFRSQVLMCEFHCLVLIGCFSFCFDVS